MEYIDGHTLSELIGKAREKEFVFSESFTMAIADEVLSGLEHAHFSDENNTHKILHRDLTPNNIMVTKHGNVKILDFGISKVSDSLDKTITQGGDSYNVEYTSPELWKDGIYSAKNYNEKNELYSLGLIIYELLCKEKAQPGFSVIAEGYKYQSVASRRPISEDYEKYLECLLSKKPSGRFKHSKVAFANLELLPSYQKSVSRSVIQEELSMLLSDSKVTAAKSYRAKGERLSSPRKRKSLLKKIGLSLMIIFFSLVGLSHLLGFIGQEELNPEALKAFEKIQSVRLTPQEIEVVEDHKRNALMLNKQIGNFGSFFDVKLKYNDIIEITVSKTLVEKFNKNLFEIEKYYIGNRDKIIKSYFKYYSLSQQVIVNSIIAGDIGPIYYGFIENLMILDLWYFGFHKEDSSTLVKKLEELDLIFDIERKDRLYGINFQNIRYNLLKKMHILKLLKPKVFLSKEFKTWFKGFDLDRIDVYQERIAERLLFDEFNGMTNIYNNTSTDVKVIISILKTLGFYSVLMIENINLNRFYREFISLNKLGPKMISDKEFFKAKCDEHKKANEFKIYPFYNILTKYESWGVMKAFCYRFQFDTTEYGKFNYLKKNFIKGFNIFDYLKNTSSSDSEYIDL